MTPGSPRVTASPGASPALNTEAISGTIAGIRARRSMTGFCVGVVRSSGLEFLETHGLARIETGAVMAPDTVLRVASISKTFTTIAILQLVEEGRFGLDTPADELLRSFRLTPRRPGLGRPTVRHLLTHTAGLPEAAHPFGVLRPEFGEAVPEGEPLPTLAEFYRGALRYDVEPGSRFIYGNHGFATLGQILEDQTGRPLDVVLRERVFTPLAMDDTSLGPLDRTNPRRATGYTIGRRGARPIPEREMVTAGAASVQSTPLDMARYLAALLAGGRGERGRILAPETISAMFEPHYRPHPALEGMGLGFFRTALAGHRVLEHGGVLSGFISQLLLAPDDDVAVMSFTNGGSGAMLWLPGETLGILETVLGVRGASESEQPQHPEGWADLVGWYAVSARPADARMRMMMGFGLEVFIRNGALMVRFLGPVPQLARGLPLSPTATPDLYRVVMSEDVSPLHVAFRRDDTGRATAAFIDIMPATTVRQPDATNPRVWAGVAAGAAGIAVLAALVRPRRGA
jgi:CubicO group peptidase (beta-lactamase class C family)